MFLHIAFSNIKKSIHKNPKISGADILLIPFSNIKKAYLQVSKYLAQFSA